MDKKTIRRYYMEPPEGPEDDKFVLFGVNWLASQPEKAVLYVPTANHLESSYLSKLYTPEHGKEFKNKMSLKFGDKDIDVITRATIKPISELVNVFVCWGDDHYDKIISKIENTYNINSILVLPWHPNDITEWKKQHSPQRLKS